MRNFFIGLKSNEKLNARIKPITNLMMIKTLNGEFSYLNKEPFHYEGPTI